MYFCAAQPVTVLINVLLGHFQHHFQRILESQISVFEVKKVFEVLEVKVFEAGCLFHLR